MAQTPHAEAKTFDKNAEHTFSYLQVLTAATASLANCANDTSNTVASLITIYLIWSTSQVQEKSGVPMWTVCYTAITMIIGLWTNGVHLPSSTLP
ncbi:PHO4-domain-containing protein [Stipitochalara longipes BDJ]|nr:PHO4-domain-containing protein [Stipitochalara longipes BDJ]